MKKLLLRGLTIIAAVLLLSACGSNSKKFNPTQRVSSLSDEEREQKLAQLREEQGGISMDTLFYSHGVKMSVLPPALNAEITENVAEKILMKLLSITTQNGIGGIGTNPCIALAVSMDEESRAATGTAPQKMIIEYNITYYVINCVTGDVYGSTSTKVNGVGSTFAQAAQNASNEIKNSSELQQMLSTSSEKIITWYNSNIPLLKTKVAEAKANGDYAFAMALLESVPEQSAACYAWANSEAPATLNAMLKQRAADSFADMKSAIAAAGVNYSPEIAAYMKMIPADSPEYKEAQKLYDSYTKGLNDERLAELDHNRKMELEEFAWMKEKTKLEMDASMKSQELNASVEKTKAFANGVTGFCAGAAAGGLLSNVLMRPYMMPFRFLRFF